MPCQTDIVGGVEAPMKRSSQLTNNSSEFCDDCEVRSITILLFPRTRC